MSISDEVNHLDENRWFLILLFINLSIQSKKWDLFSTIFIASTGDIFWYFYLPTLGHHVIRDITYGKFLSWFSVIFLLIVITLLYNFLIVGVGNENDGVV